jgi:AcrR family transcriptional regulator
LRERKKAELKRRIADTALALVRERGYDGTTIEEIVRRVDVSQPTFYKYYPSKDAILLEYAMEGFGPLLTAAQTRAPTVEEGLRMFLQALAKQMTKDRELWRAIALSDAYNPIRNPELLDAAAVSTRVVEEVIALGQTRGEFTRSFSSRRLASLLEAVVFRTCVEWGANFPKPHALGESIRESFELFLRAARPDAGPKKSAKRRAR